MRRFACLGLVGLFAACGGATSEVRGSEDAAVVPATFLRELGAQSTAVLRAPTRSIDELDADRQAARGVERRAATRDLVGAYIDAWQTASERRERRRLRRVLDRMIDAGMRGARDATLDAELDFAKLWVAYVAEESSAGPRAERFIRRYARTGGALVGLAYMISGEVALGAQRYDEARDAFRFALGQLDTPLYAYALYRIAQAHHLGGDRSEAEQARIEVARLGCPREVPALTQRVARAASQALGAGMREDPDGVVRPASCPAPSEGAPLEEQGWRPQE
ncbi:MAG: tol-pal system YbgF family protein [Sandaracinaceae bacterium]